MATKNTLDFITVSAAAKRLGISGQAATSLCRRGLLAGAFQPWGKGRGWLIPQGAVANRLQLRRKNKLPKGGRPRKSNAAKDLKNLEKSTKEGR